MAGPRTDTYRLPSCYPSFFPSTLLQNETNHGVLSVTF